MKFIHLSSSLSNCLPGIPVLIRYKCMSSSLPCGDDDVLSLLTTDDAGFVREVSFYFSRLIIQVALKVFTVHQHHRRNVIVLSGSYRVATIESTIMEASSIVQYLVEKYNLLPHPEGETQRSRYLTITLICVAQFNGHMF
jgi:hypothetical protein